jgi:hypothetical protein
MPSVVAIAYVSGLALRVSAQRRRQRAPKSASRMTLKAPSRPFLGQPHGDGDAGGAGVTARVDRPTAGRYGKAPLRLSVGRE